MELLLIIGIALVVITALSVVIEQMAEARGRNHWAWVIASLVGLAFAFVGWVVVAVALAAVGPTSEQWAHDHPKAAEPVRP